MTKQTVTLKRVNPGTFGIMQFANCKWFTCERPWADNKNDISCIPKGSYLCKWTLSPRLKRFTYEVLNVPRRQGIRIHSANFPFQVLGCIALGEKVGKMDNKQAVFSSQTAVRIFETILKKQDFTLEIK